MRSLILADSCNPEWPSLPIVAFKTARALANHCDVLVATQIRNEPNIVKHGFGEADVVFIDTEAVAAPIHRLSTAIRGGAGVGWTTATAFAYPMYIAFEAAVRRRLGRDIRNGRFDVVHRLTPMSPTTPSPMATWSTVPFVLGPLNGGLPWPPQFKAELQREREWLSRVRGLHKLLPYYRSTYRDSAAILAAFDHTRADLGPEAADRVIDFPEVGVDPDQFLPKDWSAQSKERLTAIFAGRLVPYKLPEVAVRAFANEPTLRRHRLVVVGDGPERPRLEAIIAEHGLEETVELVGWKTQDEVGELMRQADVFLFPSIRELGAGVVVEAMGSGLPCLVVDYGAPGALVGKDRGVAVPLSDPDTLIRDFGSVMSELFDQPARLREMGQRAQEHALRYYSWDAKARKFLDVYRWACGETSERPNFFSRGR
jgi:glycosyltransferase involved in cell wall biosynthesis